VDPDSPDPDPAFHVNSDLIPDPGTGFDQKLEKNTAGKNVFFNQKLQFTYPVSLLKRRPSYRRSLQPSKENMQRLKK
jgi:hypothetical protein